MCEQIKKTIEGNSQKSTFEKIKNTIFEKIKNKVKTFISNKKVKSKNEHIEIAKNEIQLFLNEKGNFINNLYDIITEIKEFKIFKKNNYTEITGYNEGLDVIIAKEIEKHLKKHFLDIKLNEFVETIISIKSSGEYYNMLNRLIVTYVKENNISCSLFLKTYSNDIFQKTLEKSTIEDFEGKHIEGAYIWRNGYIISPLITSIVKNDKNINVRDIIELSKLGENYIPKCETDISNKTISRIISLAISSKNSGLHYEDEDIKAIIENDYLVNINLSTSVRKKILQDANLNFIGLDKFRQLKNLTPNNPVDFDYFDNIFDGIIEDEPIAKNNIKGYLKKLSKNKVPNDTFINILKKIENYTLGLEEIKKFIITSKILDPVKLTKIYDIGDNYKNNDIIEKIILKLEVNNKNKSFIAELRSIKNHIINSYFEERENGDFTHSNAYKELKKKLIKLINS